MLKHHSLCALCDSYVRFAFAILIAGFVLTVISVPVIQRENGRTMSALAVAFVVIRYLEDLKDQFNGISFLVRLRRQGVPNGIACVWCNRKEPFVSTPSQAVKPLLLLTWIKGSCAHLGPHGERPDYATDGKFVYERIEIVPLRMSPDGKPVAPQYSYRRASWKLIPPNVDWDGVPATIWTDVDENGEPIGSR